MSVSCKPLNIPKPILPLSEIGLGQQDLTNQLHNSLTYEQIEEIRKIFQANNNAIQYETLRNILEEFNITLTDGQYLKLYLKLNIHNTNAIDWDEFVSYLIFCFQEDDPYSQKESLILPIPEEALVKNGNHKTPIICMAILQSVIEQEDEKQFGYYITASKDGAVNFWLPDLEVTRKGLSKSHYLKYSTTWVLCVAALSDVRIVCVSSTERELRFYDVTATNFHLRVVIKSLPYAISTMTYCYLKQDVANSKLLMGDNGGNLRILEFSPQLRGPFKSSANSNLIELSWNEVLKGKFPDMHATEYLNVFSSNITQTYYSYKLDTIYVSAASYSRSFEKSGVIAIDSRGMKNHFNISQGVSAFFLDEQNSILATGGPDSYLRFWQPYISSKASAILDGHRSGIVFIFIQPNEKKCYTVDYVRTIKVWHLIDHSILQTFSDLRILTNETQLCYLYNKIAHELLIGGRKLISIKCCPKMELDITDGNTHAGAVSVVLYNSLFENIVTCGLDSYIIVWDTWTGKRQIIMKKCHTMDLMGQTMDIEITAATFDPSYQNLITGARDGSLKIWNYNNAVCIRNLQIAAMREITAIFWIPDRILAVGWNFRVTEFADVKGLEYTDGKNWLELHESDITAGACKRGEILVTGSFIGELIFWKSETGQPYRKHNVKYPQKFYEAFSSVKKRKNKAVSLRERSTSRLSIKKAVTTRNQGITDTVLTNDTKNVKKKLKRLDNRGFEIPKFRNKEDVEIGPTLTVKLHLCIQAILILNTRPVTKDHGNVLVALDNGWVQVYSQHESGSYMDEFFASHKSGDCVISMTTDKKNKYLFTGTSFGYIKIWLLQNFCIPISEHTHICKPLLRLKFFFLSNDRITGRAKRIAKDFQPMLLSSFKGHIRSITSIVYLNIPKILITGSNDQSVRMWTRGGRYLGTLGSLVQTVQLIRNECINEKLQEFRTPPDIHKIGSCTTMKVLTGVITDHLRNHIQLNRDLIERVNVNEIERMNTSNATIEIDIKRKCAHNSKIIEPVLGKHFEMQDSNNKADLVNLDTSLPYIPVYSHLSLRKTKVVKSPRGAEEALKKIKKLEFMNYYQAKK